MFFLTGHVGGGDRELRQPAPCILSPHRGHQQKTQNVTVKTTVYNSYWNLMQNKFTKTRSQSCFEHFVFLKTMAEKCTNMGVHKSL